MYSASVQCNVYREVTSQDLVIGDSVQVSCRELERRMQGEVRRTEKTLAAGTGYVPDVVASNVALDKEVADFLRRLNLGKLKETFAIQELTYVDILDLDNDDLIAIGVNLIKDRKAILKEVAKLKDATGELSKSEDKNSQSSNNFHGENASDSVVGQERKIEENQEQTAWRREIEEKKTSQQQMRQEYFV